MLREEADKYGAVLIFDEVVTGFRFSYGGAQELYGVTPDLATFGKIIGGGFPLAATVGRADIMQHFDKATVGAEGWLMQLGTLSGNPVAAVAGLKSLEILRREGQFEKLRDLGSEVEKAFTDALNEVGIAHQIVGDPTLFEVVFSETMPRNYRDVLESDQDATKRWSDACRAHGLFKAPGKTYPSLALTEDDLEWTRTAAMAAARDAFGGGA